MTTCVIIGNWISGTAADAAKRAVVERQHLLPSAKLDVAMPEVRQPAHHAGHATVRLRD